jgi:hypothetical protein
MGSVQLGMCRSSSQGKGHLAMLVSQLYNPKIRQFKGWEGHRKHGKIGPVKVQDMK